MVRAISTEHLSRHLNEAGKARHRVVIIGAGFGGLFAARALKRSAVDVTLVDRTNHHLFQPLLYQVATGILSEGDVAPPVRDVLRKFENTRVLLGDVSHIDTRSREVVVDTAGRRSRIAYDSLIVAAGVGPSYFGHDEFAVFAPGMKTIDDALELRGRILSAFEFAELDSERQQRASWLTFAVVGAGPTGVELAGQIAELSRRALKLNYRRFDPATARVVLLEAGDRVLASFPESLQRRARRDLERLGVEVRLQTTVTGVDAAGLDIASPDGLNGRIDAHTKIWAAGVQASPLGAILAEQASAEIDRAGRVAVSPDCSLPGYPEIFVVGDLMSLNQLPGVAEVAMQSGAHAAHTITRRLKGHTEPRPFKYRDLGTMATIARFRAVASIGRVRVAGFAGWLMWLVVHLAFMTGFKNRIAAVANWGPAFLGRGRRQRALTDQALRTRAAEQVVAKQPATRGHKEWFEDAISRPTLHTKPSDTQAGPLELAAVRFGGEATAVSRYAAARARAGEASWPEKVGFVERHHNGRLLVRGVFAGHYVYVDEADHISQSGAAEGGAVGALVGALFGPPGLAVGLTLGGLIGSQGGTRSDVEVDPEPLVARLREVVPPSSSAVVGIAASAEIDEMVDALATDPTSVTRRELTSDEQRALDVSLRVAPLPADRQGGLPAG
jgi:NADH dehydrogenase